MRKFNINFIVGVYFGIVVWWLSLYLSGTKDASVINGFSAVWTIVALFVSFYTLLQISRIRTLVTNNRFIISILFLALGLSIWCFGNLIWVVYNTVLNVSIPFPSYADVLFLGCLPFLLVGSYDFFNSEVNNIYNVELNIAKRLVIVAMSVSCILSVAFFVKEDAILLRFVINMFFVIFDILILSFILAPWILVVVTNKRFRYNVGSLILLFGVVSLLVSDVGFFYGTSNNIYINGGVVDLFYMSFTFIFGIALLIIIKEFYPPFANDYAGFGANYLVKISYLRQVSLNCISGISGLIATNPSLTFIFYIPVLFVS